MKRLFSLVAAVVLVFLSGTSAAQVCSSPINLNPLSRPAKIAAIQGAFALPCTYIVEGSCEICFTMSEFEILVSDGITGFSLNVGGGESRNIYVVGLNLAKEDSLDTDDSLFDVTHNGTGILYLENIHLSNVKNGLKLAGAGAIQFASYGDNPVTITGNASKSGACIEIKSPGAILDGVQVSGCDDGVRVDADNVQIKNESVITDNHIGVHIMSGRKKTNIEKSLVYFNDDGDPATCLRDDGIRIDDGVMHEVVFYDVIDDEPMPLLDGDSTIEYTSRKPYLLLDLDKGESGKVEFVISGNESCDLPANVYSYNQACKIVTGMINPVQINGDQLTAGPVEVTIAPEHYDKALVVIFSDTVRGTAGISRQFRLYEASGGVVAFVANPYDIPTSGGVSDAEIGSGSEDDYTEEGSGSGAGGDGVVTEGGGGIVSTAGAAGGCGGGASLAGDTFRTAVLFMDLWWNLIVVGLILGLRRAYVRAHTHTHNNRNHTRH